MSASAPNDDYEIEKIVSVRHDDETGEDMATVNTEVPASQLKCDELLQKFNDSKTNEKQYFVVFYAALNTCGWLGDELKDHVFNVLRSKAKKYWGLEAVQYLDDSALKINFYGEMKKDFLRDAVRKFLDAERMKKFNLCCRSVAPRAIEIVSRVEEARKVGKRALVLADAMKSSEEAKKQRADPSPLQTNFGNSPSWMSHRADTKKSKKIADKFPLREKTVFISGVCDALGDAMARELLKKGANVVLGIFETHPATTSSHEYSAIVDKMKKECDADGRLLLASFNPSNKYSTIESINDAVRKFGGIDVLCHNVINISAPPDGSLLEQYNCYHEFFTKKVHEMTLLFVPYLKNSENAHVLVLAPPLNLDLDFSDLKLPLKMALKGLSVCVASLMSELDDTNVSVNCLWAMNPIWCEGQGEVNVGSYTTEKRTPMIVADAAAVILAKSEKYSANFLIDEQVLRMNGKTDFKEYSTSPDVSTFDKQRPSTSGVNASSSKAD